MDDGASGPDVSLKMLLMLAAQGVPDVIATPHYYPDRESVDRYLERRRRSLDDLKTYVRESGTPGRLPRLWLGAETAIVPRLYERDLSGLFMAGTRHLLLEPPYAGYEPWVTEEILGVRSRHGAIPVLAHLERYLDFYDDEALDELLSVPDVVVQINVAAFGRREALRFVRSLAEGGFPIILGSDTHDLAGRSPDLSVALKYLRGKKDGPALLEHIRKSEFTPGGRRPDGGRSDGGRS
jgi:protein-tyrosine phosphatase